MVTDLAMLAASSLLNPVVESVRRPDEFYVTVHCGVEVQKQWGKQVYGACHRAVWYERRGYTNSKRDDAAGMRKMYWGNVLHEAEIELYKKLGIYIADEISFWLPEYYLRGRIDCFVRDPDSWTGQDLIAKGGAREGVIGVEIKTSWSHGSRGTIETPAGVKPWPKWEHIIQAALYHNVYKKYANYWQIVYLARDSGKSRVHNLVVLDEGNRISVNGEIIPFTVDHIFARLAKLSHELRNDVAPPRDFELVYDKERLKLMADAGEFGKTDTEKIRKSHKVVKGDWQCGYCKFTKLCWQKVSLPYETEVDRMIR